MSTENQTNVLDTLVGEGKKFASVEALAAGKLEADRFVERILQEKQELAEQLKQALKAQDKESALEKIMTELTNKNQNTTDPSQTQTTPPQKVYNQTTGLTQEEVVRLIEAQEVRKREDANLNRSLAKFKEVYGDKSEEALKTTADKLGLTVETLHSLARTSPDAFFNTVGLNQRDSSTRSMTNNGRSGESFTQTPADNGERNRAYYENLRKEMGGAKFALDTRLQAQMWRDITTLGDRFG
jgi:hypothetical protein